MQRTVKFVKHLGQLGYAATVVTGPERADIHWAPPDPALGDEVPSEVRVLRADDSQPPPGRTRMQRLLRLPAQLETWWRLEAARLGRTVLEDVDLVYASMSPFGTAAVAETLACESARPWIADLRDPWALDEWTVYPTALHKVLERRTMRRELRGAAAIVANTPEAARVLAGQFPELGSSRLVTIPNGWDREDFDGGVPARGDDRFRIVYTGYTHVDAGRRHHSRRPFRTLLGGAVRGLDVLARSHVFLLEALERLEQLDPDLAGRVEVHLAGAASPSAEPQSSHVVHHGYLPHRAAVRLMRSADALFLPMHDLPRGVRSRTVPGKTYEYLAAGRPIVAALPDGDARDLLEGLPNVWLCRPRDIDAIATALREIGRAGSVPPPAPEVLERFERRQLAVRLAALFDEVLDARSVR